MIVGGIFSDLAKKNAEFDLMKHDFLEYMNDKRISNQT